MYCGWQQRGGQHGLGQQGLGSQQRGLGGHGSQQGSRSQQQLVKADKAKAIKPIPRKFFILFLLLVLELQECKRTIPFVKFVCKPLMTGLFHMQYMLNNSDLQKRLYLSYIRITQ